MKNLELLKPGTFVKTKGARDGVGLRKIVEVRNADTPYPHLLVVKVIAYSLCLL